MINYSLILAGGRGLRMMPLTEELPKPMIEINGCSIISASIAQLRDKIPQIAITVGYKGSKLAKHVIENGVDMIFNTSNRGNAWWIFNTLMKFVNEPVLVLTCDNVVNLDLDFIFDNYCDLGHPVNMLIPVAPVAGIDGDYIEGEDWVVRSLSRAVTTNLFCSGMQIINPFLLNQIVPPVDDFAELWECLIKQNKLRYSKNYPGKWYTMNTLRDLEALKVMDFDFGKIPKS